MQLKEAEIERDMQRNIYAEGTKRKGWRDAQIEIEIERERERARGTEIDGKSGRVSL